MATTSSITFAIPPGITEDYDRLRAQGLSHLIHLGRDLWTDFNAHDPGITILEVLCYALIDLGYRTGFPIEDLLAANTENGPDELKQFFTVAEIFPSNPVTPLDFRKLLIDIEEVKNAWLLEGDLEDEDTMTVLTYYITEDRIKEFDALAEGIFALGAVQGGSPEMLLNNMLTAWENSIDRITADEQTIKKVNAYKALAHQFFDFILEFAVDIDKDKSIYTIGTAALLKCKEIIRKIREIKRKSFSRENLFAGLLNQELWLRPFVSQKHVRLAKSALSDTLKAADLIAVKKLPYSGLYTILIELQNQLDPTDRLQTDDLQKKVSTLYHQYRNLCEDVSEIIFVGEKHLKLGGEIELEDTADVNEVQARVIHKVQQFLTPAPQFYSLQEMRDKKKTYDQIFQGKILRHGFLDDDEVEEAKLRRLVYTSDLYQEILDVEGIKAVRGLTVELLNDKDQAAGYESAWYLDICQKEQKEADGQQDNYTNRISCHHKPVLDETLAEAVGLTYFKDILPTRTDPTEVREKLALLRQLDRRPRVDLQRDKTYKRGDYRDIHEVYSIQNDFPLCYRVGEGEIRPTASDEHKADIKNLKSYLTFFDQILANYLAHLLNVRKTLAVYQEPEDRSAFFMSLKDIVPGFEQLLILHYLLTEEVLDKLVKEKKLEEEHKKALEPLSLRDPMPGEPFAIAVQELLGANAGQYLPDILEGATYRDYYEHKLEELVQRGTKGYELKNKILDHLIARFGEKFNDYALFLYHKHKSESCKEKGILRKRHLLNCKASFLRNIPALGRDKSKAFNYKDRICSDVDQFFISGNVSGLKKRVYKLLCIPDPADQVASLGGESSGLIGRLSSREAFEISKKFDSEGKHFRFVVIRKGEDPSDQNTVIYLTGEKPLGRRSKGYKDRDQITEALLKMDEPVSQSNPAEKFLRIAQDDLTQKYLLELYNRNGAIIAKSKEYENQEEAKTARETILALVFPEKNEIEGFHVLEHVLLRPFSKDIELLDPFPVEAGSNSYTDDPYSFWISVIAPDQWARFPDQEAKTFFEQTVRREAPAHTGIRFLWITSQQMYKFEDAYLNWLYDEGRRHSNECQIEESMNKLIEIMNGLLA